MKELLSELVEQVRTSGYFLPALIGGLVDFLNRIRVGALRWAHFAPHMLAAMFFGWLSGTFAFEFFHSVAMVAACGGVGGFLGSRLPNIILYGILKMDRRK